MHPLVTNHYSHDVIELQQIYSSLTNAHLANMSICLCLNIYQAVGALAIIVLIIAIILSHP